MTLLGSAGTTSPARRVGIGGLGTIGRGVAAALAEGIDGFELAAVSARDEDRALERMAELPRPAPVVRLEELAGLCDVVIECAPPALFSRVAGPAVDAGRVLVPLSVGALLEHWELVERAERTGARILVPSGAMIGLDGLRAAAEGEIHSVTLITRKPPQALAGAPYLVEQGISLDDLDTAVRVFEGSARETALRFPANTNVGAALSLAGIGPDRTRVEVWADPELSRNTHTVRLVSDSSDFEFTIENRPSDDNPRTGRITAQSVIALLRGMTATLRVGS